MVAKTVPNLPALCPGREVGQVVALAEQNAIDLVPVPYLAAHLYKQTTRGIAAEGGQRCYECRMGDLSFWRVGSMHVLGGDWFSWKGSFERGSRQGGRS